MAPTTLDIITAHTPALLGLALLLLAATGLLVAKNIERMREMSAQRKLPMMLITSAIAGFGLWSAHFMMLAAYTQVLPNDFNVGHAMPQIGASCCWFVALSVVSQSSNRVLEKVALALIPFYPALLNYWAVTNMVGTAAAGFSTFLAMTGQMLLASSFVALLVSRPDWTGKWVPHRYAAFLAVLNLAIHVVMLDAYGLTPDVVEAIRLGQSHDDAIPISLLVLPIGIANLLILAVGGANYSMDSVATAESVEKYRRLAMEDRLTDLPNRASLAVDLDSSLLDRPESDALAVALIDLDRFKEVNDVHGHAAGDALLVGLARYVGSRLQPDETLYRMGGDEFVAIKKNIDDREAALAFGESICEMVRRFESPATGDIKVGASIGVSVFPGDGFDREALVSHADVAMYRAKKMGRNLVCGFESKMEEENRRKSMLSMELGHAIERDQLSLVFQPQIVTETGGLIGFEVLTRWTHPKLGEISPQEFFPLAEETGQIVDIGEWVLRKACLEAAEWARPYRIAVNVAAGQLARSPIIEMLKKVFDETGLQASRLELEITESGIIKDEERAYKVLRDCSKLGISIAMDDFGTGYSSLSTLQNFPFDKIKIDQSFVKAVGTDRNAAAIVKATVTLAHEMDIRVLAEGVETDEQYEFLRAAACGEIQGFYFAKPMTADGIREAYHLMSSTNVLFDLDTEEELDLDKDPNAAQLGRRTG